MIICSKCKIPVVGRQCPKCGHEKFLTEAKDGDLVILTSTDYVTSFLIEEMLNEADIKFLKKGALGSAVTLYIGEFSESFDFYVVAEDYDRALPLISDLDASEFEIPEDDFVDDRGAK